MSEINKKVKIKQLEDRQEEDQIFINTRAQDVYVKDISELVVDKTRSDTVIPALEPDNEQIPGNSENEDLVTFLRKTKYFTNRLGNTSNLNVNTLKEFRRFIFIPQIDTSRYNNTDVIYLKPATGGYTCIKYIPDNQLYTNINPDTMEVGVDEEEAFITFDEIKNRPTEIELNQMSISIYENVVSDSNVNIVFPENKDTAITYDYVGRDVYLHISRKSDPETDRNFTKYNIISIKYNTLNSDKTTIEYNVLANINKYLDDMFAGTEDIIELINSVSDYTTYEKIDEKPFEYYTGKSFDNINVGDIFTVNHDTLGKCYCTVIGKYDSSNTSSTDTYREVIDDEPSKYVTCLLLTYENDIRFPFNHFKSKNYPSGEQIPNEYEHNILKNYYPWSLIFQYMNSDEIYWFNSPYTKINNIYINYTENFYGDNVGELRFLNVINSPKNQKFFKVSVNNNPTMLDIQDIRTDTTYSFDVSTDTTNKYKIKGFLQGFPKRFKDILVKFNKNYRYETVYINTMKETINDISLENQNDRILIDSSNDHYLGYLIKNEDNVPAYMHLLSLSEVYGYSGYTYRDSSTDTDYNFPSYYRSVPDGSPSNYPSPNSSIVWKNCVKGINNPITGTLQGDFGSIFYVVKKMSSLVPEDVRIDHTDGASFTNYPSGKYKLLGRTNSSIIGCIQRLIYDYNGTSYDYIDITLDPGFGLNFADASLIINSFNSRTTALTFCNDENPSYYKAFNAQCDSNISAGAKYYGFNWSNKIGYVIGRQHAGAWANYPSVLDSNNNPIDLSPDNHTEDIYIHLIIPVLYINTIINSINNEISNNRPSYAPGIATNLYNLFDSRPEYSQYRYLNITLPTIDMTCTYTSKNSSGNFKRFVINDTNKIYDLFRYTPWRYSSVGQKSSTEINLSKPVYYYEGTQYPYFHNMSTDIIVNKSYNTITDKSINSEMKKIISEKYNKKTSPSGEYNANGYGVIESIPLRTQISKKLIDTTGNYLRGSVSTTTYDTYGHSNPILYIKGNSYGPSDSDNMKFVLGNSTPTNISLGDGYSSILGAGSDDMFENSIHPIFVLNADIDSN